MIRLNMDLYLKAFATSITHKGITGGTIHNFLKESTVKYYGGKCPVWYVEHYHNGHRCVIGGNYARPNNKPQLRINEPLDFD